MDSILRKSRIQALEDSLIALQRQAEALQEMVRDGTKRWAGGSPKEALATTAKAIMHDAGKLQDLCGADEWSESKKQFALSILREE